MIPFMLNCHDATALMSKGRDETLTRAERVKVRLHAAMCSGCSSFEQQLIVMGEVARACAQDAQAPDSETAAEA